MLLIRVCILAFYAVVLAGCGRVIAPAAPAELLVDGNRLVVELALDDDAQERGLSHRDRLDDDRGMLFVLRHPSDVCMWMRGTAIPLSAAFLDARGAIINVADMAPQTDTQHCAAAPAMYVLEVRRGWFAKRNIRPGGHVLGLPLRRD